MALSAFDDKEHIPAKDEVSAVLGDTASLWDELISRIASRFDPLSEDWGFSGKKWGWSLRLKHKKRAILYLTPTEGFFYAGFALGQNAVNAARESDLPKAVLDFIDSSPKYAEGRGGRLEVRNANDLKNVATVATLKMAN